MCSYPVKRASVNASCGALALNTTRLNAVSFLQPLPQHLSEKYVSFPFIDSKNCLTTKMFIVVQTNYRPANGTHVFVSITEKK